MSPRLHTRRAVFVDRDGVICRNRSDYVKSWEEFVFLPGALEALTELARTDLYIVIVTNQSAINRGIVSAETVEEINSRMVLAIEAAGGRVDRVMYCPHRPDEHCACRKPQPGMLVMAAEDLGLDLAHSYLIGDAETDMQAGRAVGCRRYLVLTGRGRRQLVRSLICGKLDFVVKWNLKAAAKVIVRQKSEVEWGYSHLAFGEGSSH